MPRRSAPPPQVRKPVAPPRNIPAENPEEDRGLPAGFDDWGVGSDETFSQCLYRLMRKTATSQAQLANGSWLDRAYVNRLVNTGV